MGVFGKDYNTEKLGEPDQVDEQKLNVNV